MDAYEVMAAVEAAREDLEALRRENGELMGRLREARRAGRQWQRAAMREAAEARANRRYWVQLTVAACGLCAALTCLIITLVICMA